MGPDTQSALRDRLARFDSLVEVGIGRRTELAAALVAAGRAVARDAGARFLFTTLGGDEPLVPVERESLPGETLYAARADRPDNSIGPSGRRSNVASHSEKHRNAQYTSPLTFAR